jgi:hypothetical protein
MYPIDALGLVEQCGQMSILNEKTLVFVYDNC